MWSALCHDKGCYLHVSYQTTSPFPSSHSWCQAEWHQGQHGVKLHPLSSCLVKCQYRNAYWNPLFWMRRKWRVLTIFLGDIFDPVMQMIRTLFVFVGAVSTMYITIGVWVHVCFRVQTWISCTTTSECIMKDARTEPCHLISEHASGDMVPLWSKFPPLPLVIALVPLEMFVI